MSLSFVNKGSEQSLLGLTVGNGFSYNFANNGFHRVSVYIEFIGPGSLVLQPEILYNDGNGQQILSLPSAVQSATLPKVPYYQSVILHSLINSGTGVIESITQVTSGTGTYNLYTVIESI